MPKTRPPKAPVLQHQMVDPVRAGRDPEDIAREFAPSAQAIRNWVADADRRDAAVHRQRSVFTASFATIDVRRLSLFSAVRPLASKIAKWPRIRAFEIDQAGTAYLRLVLCRRNLDRPGAVLGLGLA